MIHKRIEEFIAEMLLQLIMDMYVIDKRMKDLEKKNNIRTRSRRFLQYSSPSRMEI